MRKVLLTLSLMLVTIAVMAVPAKKGIWKTITIENGQVVKAQVCEVTETEVTIDLNHPYAGADLHFKGVILDIREASAAELEAIRHPRRGCGGCGRKGKEQKANGECGSCGEEGCGNCGGCK